MSERTHVVRNTDVRGDADLQRDRYSHLRDLTDVRRISDLLWHHDVPVVGDLRPGRHMFRYSDLLVVGHLRWGADVHRSADL